MKLLVISILAIIFSLVGLVCIIHSTLSQPPVVYEVVLSNGEVVKGQVWQNDGCTIILLPDGSKIATGELVKYKRIE